ncbi:MAG: hypothetical protein M3271_09980 [Actinomycetota bacterium]|nr:hypothetical protein [Actinomycetota bacterium]
MAEGWEAWMRARALVIAAAVACFASVASVQAAAPRRAMLPYDLRDVNHHFAVPGAGFGVWDTQDAYQFSLNKGEKAVSVMILDDREGPVAGVVVQWTTDLEAGGALVGHAMTWERFCTETDAPVRVVPDAPVEIILKKGTCEDGTPSLPTTGDIVVDFHRKA